MAQRRGSGCQNESSQAACYSSGSTPPSAWRVKMLRTARGLKEHLDSGTAQLIQCLASCTLEMEATLQDSCLLPLLPSFSRVSVLLSCLRFLVRCRSPQPAWNRESAKLKGKPKPKTPANTLKAQLWRCLFFTWPRVPANDLYKAAW